MPLLAGKEEGDIGSYTSDVAEAKQDEVNQMLKVSIALNIFTTYSFFDINTHREGTYFKLAVNSLVFEPKTII